MIARYRVTGTETLTNTHSWGAYIRIHQHTNLDLSPCSARIPSGIKRYLNTHTHTHTHAHTHTRPPLYMSFSYTSASWRHASFEKLYISCIRNRQRTCCHASTHLPSIGLTGVVGRSLNRFLARVLLSPCGMTLCLS